MEKKLKTKQQLLLEVEELRSRLESTDRRLKETTDQAQTEEALKISETRYRRLFETAQDGILILDAETGQIADVNPFLVEMLGYSYADFLGKRLWEIGPFKNIKASKASFLELQDKGYVRFEDLPLETKDGRQIAVEFVSNVYLVNHHKVIQCNIRDITERKLIAEGFRKSPQRTGTPGRGANGRASDGERATGAGDRRAAAGRGIP